MTEEHRIELALVRRAIVHLVQQRMTGPNPDPNCPHHDTLPMPNSNPNPNHHLSVHR